MTILYIAQSTFVHKYRLLGSASTVPSRDNQVTPSINLMILALQLSFASSCSSSSFSTYSVFGPIVSIQNCEYSRILYSAWPDDEDRLGCNHCRPTYLL